jgi:hypothetical protein
MQLFTLQISPWQKNTYIFLSITPIQVNPKPTFSIRRARSNGTLFTKLTLSENDHITLAPYSALRGRNLSGESFREMIALLPRVFLHPRQADHLIYALKDCFHVVLVCVGTYMCINIPMLVCIVVSCM